MVAVLVYSRSQGGGKISHLHEIFIDKTKRSLSSSAELLQISFAESTYLKQLTFVLTYRIISATESLKSDPLRSSFLLLLTLTGQVWQVEVQQSSLIKWNKSIGLKTMAQLQIKVVLPEFYFFLFLYSAEEWTLLLDIVLGFFKCYVHNYGKNTL